VFAEAAAAVFGEPDQHLVAEQEVTEAVCSSWLEMTRLWKIPSRVRKVVSRAMEHRLLPCLWRKDVYVWMKGAFRWRNSGGRLN